MNKDVQIPTKCNQGEPSSVQKGLYATSKRFIPGMQGWFSRWELMHTAYSHDNGETPPDHQLTIPRLSANARSPQNMMRRDMTF